jgi:hypothetical protein
MQSWMQLSQPDGPQSFLFYVVANIRGRHRPLGVVLHQGQRTIQVQTEPSVQGRIVILSCLRIIDIFSDPANRAMVQAEMALAAEFYSRQERAPLVELPTLNRWALGNEEFEGRRRPWDCHSIPEFPFILTCLLLGVSCDGRRGDTYTTARTEPLGTVYRDDSLEYGMVVLDISNLDEIRYGIVGFVIRLTMEITPITPRLRDGTPRGPRVLTVEENRPREPLSASQYMSKFGYSADETFDVLQRRPLINPSAMDCEV